MHLDYGFDLVSVRQRKQALQRYLSIRDVGTLMLLTEGICKAVPKIEKLVWK